MTIKQPENPITFNIDWHKLIFYSAVVSNAALLVFTIFFPQISSGNVILVNIILAALAVFVSYERLGISQQQKVYVLAFIFGAIFITLLLAINENKRQFVELVKTEHPQLITGHSSCSGKKNNPIGEYKLVKINGTYYAKTDNGKLELEDLREYKYEEF